MNKIEYYQSMHNNINILKKDKIDIEGDYICPLCMQKFNEEEVKTILTEEDVPQRSLGGKRIALTCKKCNNTCGAQIDIHLYNAIVSREQRLFLPGTNRRVRIEKDDRRLNGELRIENDGIIKLLVNTKKNSPQNWENFRSNILIPNEIVTIEDSKLKKEERRIAAAILKNAYMLLFAKTGYTFLYDTYYDKIRNQISDPDIYYLPDRLWTIQQISIPDGIYLTEDNRYRGFFVVYTLRLEFSYRVCVLIPTPLVPYLAVAKQLQKIEADSSIQVLSLPNLDFLNDLSAIERLKKWSYGWNLKF